MPFQNFVAEHQTCPYATAHQRSQGGTIVCSENRKEYRYEYVQGETFLRIHVDGGLVRDKNQPRCDDLLLNTTAARAETNQPNFHSIFIELKGTDILKACQQLQATVTSFANELTGSKLHARIVVSKAHGPKTSLQRYQREFNRRLKCSFDYQSQTMSERTGKDGDPSTKK